MELQAPSNPGLSQWTLGSRRCRSILITPQEVYRQKFQKVRGETFKKVRERTVPYPVSSAPSVSISLIISSPSSSAAVC